MEANLKSIKWSDVLPEGEDNSIPAAELAQRIGVKDTRTVRAVVLSARMQGVPIMSRQAGTKSGYFLPDVRRLDQVKHTIAELKKGSYTRLKLCKVLSQWLEDQEQGDADRFTQSTIEDFIKTMEG